MAVITILGAGVMGSAMAMPAIDRGHRVRLVGTHLDDAVIAAVQAGGPHPRLNLVLPVSAAVAWQSFGDALGGDTNLVILGVSSAGVGWAIDRLAATLKEPLPVVMITKGLAADGTAIRVFPDVVADELEHRLGFRCPVVAIGGPCIAGELAARRQTGVVMTSRQPGLAGDIAALLVTDYYQPRVSVDVIGVEVCAALKNFYAIAVGWAAGQLESHGKAANGALNHNPAAVLFAQAIAEMAEFTRALGGDPASAWGMAGAGDLYVTCQAGRNSRLGRLLGQGLSYAAVRSGPMRGETIEGAELGIALAPTLKRQFADGRLDPAALPLARSLITALADDQPLQPNWPALHSGVA